MRKYFIDLDGVLTDFSKQLADLLEKPLDRDWDFGNDPKVWKKINGAGEKFWSEMAWMPDGHDLWDFVKKLDPTVLTAPSNHPSSKAGKKVWLKENLPDVPYIIDGKKDQYAKKDYVLIDDREKNIKKWEKAGGTGILHKDAKSTIEKLEKLMEDKKKEASGGMIDVVARLDALSDVLEAAGFVKEAFHLDKVADAWENFLRSENKGPQLRKMPIKPFFGGDDRDRVHTVMDVLSDISKGFSKKSFPPDKRALAESVMRELKEMSQVSSYDDQAVKDNAKKSILAKASEIDLSVGELVGLLFAPVTNNMERMNKEHKINSLAKSFLRGSGYSEQLPSDIGYSKAFSEGRRRAASLDLSGLSEEHARIVKAHLTRIFGLT